MVLVFMAYRLMISKKEGVKNREFGYLRWVIYLINLLIFVLGLGLVLGLIAGIFTWFGGDWLANFSNDASVGFSFDTYPQSPLSIAIDVINTISALGILVCMRSFMKNILAEEIFVAENVRLAKLSTIFLILGSLVREGIDKSSLVMHGEYTSGAGTKVYEYSFFSLNYLLTAVLVWTPSLILQKAVAIAEENEFTI